MKRPIIAELGAGYGKLAYFLLRNFHDSCYIDFDLPETLCVAAYYLMLVWPEKKVLLYGEEECDSFSWSRYDLIFMPSWEIEKLERKSIDLFLNINSLGEMTGKAVNNYIHYITNSTIYFLRSISGFQEL